jgi:hypothetical protein
LWDRFFLSTGSAEDKRAFAGNPMENPLPNARMKPAHPEPDPDDLADCHLAAASLMMDGAFNVNSTRVEAWKAILASSRLTGYGSEGKAPFPRVFDPPDGAWTAADSAMQQEVWSGFRELNGREIDLLARAIVEQVKRRGPFISLADFVNRRLAEDETGRMGAIEAAIRMAGLNSALAEAYPLDNRNPLPDFRHPDNIADATLMEQTLKPDSKAWGAAGWLTQGDVLQSLAPVLSARSDTFVIRAYGDATDAGGKVAARAWCEAVVQRTPEPLNPDESGINPRQPGSTGDFGRRFVITSFRWLSAEEI